MSIDYTSQIEQLYVAYFDRPADVAGLDYWNGVLNGNGGKTAVISQAFAASAEYTAAFAGLDNYAIVNQIYLNLFNRSAEAGGLTYWGDLLNAHSISINDVVDVVLQSALLNPAGNADRVSVESKIAAATAFTHALDTPAEILGYHDGSPVSLAKEWLASIHDSASAAAATEPAALNASIETIIATPVDPSVDYTLGSGVDTPFGGTGDDTFRATQATLQLGDVIHGGAGQDTLLVSISGPGIVLNGFAADSVETIEVKSLATSASTIDFSDVTGLTNIVSNETDGATLNFQDIQSVNDVKIEVIDTLNTHNFTYDVQAYTDGVDVADVTLQEIRHAELNFGTTHGILGASDIEQVDIHSVNVENIVQDLNVGNALVVLNIDGDANLEIVSALDPNLETVNAEGLNANLTLDLTAESVDITVTGAQGDNVLDFGTESHDKTVTTFDGADVIIALGGVNNIDTGAGDDSVSSGVGADVISLGSGDDVLVDLGGNNTITAGSGDDHVNIEGTGNNNIDLGDGNDILVLEARGLEVYDTITGGSGIDTIELHNTGGSAALGHVLASETQQTSSIEVFDLHDSNITLALTDHLVETAQDNSLTVSTLHSEGDQTIDIRAITTPLYHVSLDGGEFKDTVIANEQTINSFSTLSFGDSNSEDTLVIYGDANISATDTINITGLERIELKADTTEPATWSIDLTTGLLDQTTGAAPLHIVVSPNTPQGSILYLNTVGLNSAIDVYVERNSNVKVYVNGTPIVASGTVSNAVYNNANALGELFVQTELHFTTNADSLVGSGFGDTFYADSLAQIQPSDYANGGAGSDTLVLGAGLTNGATLYQQFDHAVISSIETLTISDNPGFAVHFADSNTESYDFTTFNLTAGDDVVDHAQSNHTFNTFDGNDIVNLDASVNGVTVNGGGGSDTVNFTDFAQSPGGASSVFISEVEHVVGDNADNTVTILGTNTVAVHLELGAGNDVVQGSSHGDELYVDGGTNGRAGDIVYGNGGDDLISTWHVETIDGGSGNDTITTETHSLATDTADTVIGGAGDDTITLWNTHADTVVFGTEALHTGGLPVAVSSGYDVINNFAAGAVNPGANEDVLDVSGLIHHSGSAVDIRIGDLHQFGGIDLNDPIVGNSRVGVIWNANYAEIIDNAGTTFVATPFATAGHIAIHDNGEAVIAFTSDAEGDNVGSVILAYVADTDAGSGQTWEVTIIGTVHFDQLTGLNSGTLNTENFIVG